MTRGPQRPPPLTYRLMHAMLGALPKRLGLSCRDALELCSERMDRDLSKGESFRLRLHLIMCSVCRHLPAQFHGLRRLVQACEHRHEESSTACLPEESKARIAAGLEKMNRKP